MNPAVPSACNAVVDEDGFAYLTMRKPGEDTVELGVHAFGPNANVLATMLADLVRVWDCDHRHGPGPQYTISPAHMDDHVLDGAEAKDKAGRIAAYIDRGYVLRILGDLPVQQRDLMEATGALLVGLRGCRTADDVSAVLAAQVRGKSASMPS
ncbi:hypothetical protein ACIBCT_22370 [Streptosporangium sp. NPDC050855]|uniref:hypothetical protein n=1 Tax=Streptosporangium sp. NPDC050855 TaxID=3366194 RepID=UPI003787A8ED